MGALDRPRSFDQIAPPPSRRDALRIALEGARDIIAATAPHLRVTVWEPRPGDLWAGKPARLVRELRVWWDVERGPVVLVSARHASQKIEKNRRAIWLEARTEPTQDDPHGRLISRVTVGDDMDGFIEDLITEAKPHPEGLLDHDPDDHGCEPGDSDDRATARYDDEARVTVPAASDDTIAVGDPRPQGAGRLTLPTMTLATLAAIGGVLWR